MPVLQGHNPDTKEEFISFEKTAKYLEEYLINNYGNNVYAVYGMSMGGVLAAFLWQNRRVNIDKLILESAPLLSYNKFMANILINQYLKLTHKTQERNKKVVAQAVNSIIPENKLDKFLEVIDGISDTTIVNYIRSVGDYKLPNNIDTPETELIYYHGTKFNELLAKKTSRYIKINYPNAKIICFKGKGHCENSILNPDKMIIELDKVLKL